MIQLLSGFDDLAGEEKELMHPDAQPTAAELRKIASRVMNSSRASATLREQIRNLGL
jgi:hypothetical protein